MPDGELSVQVNAEGVADAAQEFEDANEDGGGLPGIAAPGGGGGGGPGGGGGMLGQLMSSMSGMSGAMMGILGALGLVVGLLASLKPVQKMIEGLFKIVQAFVAPLAVMLIRLLSPVLGFLMRLLPIWMDFLSDPEGAIQNAMAWLRGALFDMAEHLVSLLPNWLTEPLGGGGNGGGSAFDTERSIMNPERRREIISDPSNTQSNEGTEVNIFGGLETFIDRITRDGTVKSTPGPGP